MSVDPRLQRLLGGNEFAALRLRLRRRFERLDAKEAGLPFRLEGLTPSEHEVLASLMGRPAHFRKSVEVDVAAVDAVLASAGIAATLRQALEALDGPIAHHKTFEGAIRDSWPAVVGGARHAGLRHFLDSPIGLGLLKRLSRQDSRKAAALRDSADAVLARLPVLAMPRAQLAADVLGDAHALDSGRPTATLVLAALHQPGDAADAEGSAAPEAQERARTVWARAGVLVNELVKPALVLNLPIHGGGPPFASPGEPVFLSLRLLLRATPTWDACGRRVHVCTNPNLLAIAADRLGDRCAPLVCTDGMPAAAQRTLLAQLAAAGARLLYHGDFDWPGLRIGNEVVHGLSVEAWRYGCGDYLQAVGDVTEPDRRHGLSGTPIAALWDASLAPAMQQHGIAVTEESLATRLLADLMN